MGTSRSKVKALFGQRILVLFLLLVLLLSVTGCGVKSAGTTSPVPQVVPQREPLPTPRAEIPVSKAPALSFNGEVRAKDQVALAAKVSGRISEVKVGVGDQVKKKDLLVVLEHEAQDAQVKQAEASLAAAEAALKGAQAQLDLLQAGATKEQIAAAEAALRGPEASVRSAEANLALLLAGATKEQIAAAEASLAAAQARLDLLLAGPKPEELRIAEFEVEMAEQELTLTTYRTSAYSLSPALMETYMMLRLEEIKSARQQVDLARQQLELLKSPPRQEELAQLKAAVDASRAQLEALKAPPRPQQVAQLKAAVDAAKAQLDVAKAQLEVLKAPPRPQEVSRLEATVDGATAQVALAQASLSLARAQKEEAFLYSPLEGRVAYRGLSVGALASPGVPILTIVSREMEVVIAVDEIALRQVSPGQVVSITVPANPEQVFAGKVRAIAPMANSVTRTFEVSVDPQDPKELLRPGMFAVISF